MSLRLQCGVSTGWRSFLPPWATEFAVMRNDMINDHRCIFKPWKISKVFEGTSKIVESVVQQASRCSEVGIVWCPKRPRSHYYMAQSSALKAPPVNQISLIKVESHKPWRVCVHMRLHARLSQCVSTGLWVSACVCSGLNTQAFNVKALQGFNCSETCSTIIVCDIQQGLSVGFPQWKNNLMHYSIITVL